MSFHYKRTSLRAPLSTQCLYEDNGYVFRGSVKNISEGGILLGQLPHVPEINLIPLLVDIPIFPTFELVDEINPMHTYEHSIVRMRGKIVRSFEEKSAVDQIFIPFIGCQFAPLSDEVMQKIKDYVSQFSKNIIYLLNLFESGRTRKETAVRIRKIAVMLGYDGDLHMPILRQKILHDYQSLESL